MSLPNHGANPAHTIKALGLAVEKDLLDFSVNTNPYGLPLAIKHRWLNYFQNVESYPDPHVTELRLAISKKEDVSTEQVLVGNGAAELIFMIANYYRNKNVLIVEPTFSEYRDACTAFGSHVESFLLSEAEGWQIDVDQLTCSMEGKDLLFICHPNNPTGVVYDSGLWLPLLNKAEQLGVTIVVDEAFYDFCLEDISISALVKQFSNLIVLRSLTKMYAIAGIRLGYLLANDTIINELKKLQHPWSVNGIAQQMGRDCLLETNHVEETKQRVATERNRLFLILQDLGYDVSNSRTNYYLLKERYLRGDQKPLMTFLIEQGIIPRHTYNFNGLNGEFLRLAIKKENENDQLLKALTSWKKR